MSIDSTSPRDGRRHFLTRLGTFFGASALGATSLHAASTSRARRRRGDAAPDPLVHEADAWIDALPDGHRMVWDAYTTAGAVDAGRFCANWIASNESGYALTASQLGAIIVLRSQATIFAFTDAMWAKYPIIGQQLRAADPATGAPYTANPFLQPARADSPSQGVSWAPLIAKGVHFAVCAGTTAGLAGAIASTQSRSAEEVRAELVANQIGNAHQMATGILALGRAQEKGFTYGGGG